MTVCERDGCVVTQLPTLQIQVPPQAEARDPTAALFDLACLREPLAALLLLLLQLLLEDDGLQRRDDWVRRRSLPPENRVHCVPPPLTPDHHHRSLLALHLVSDQSSLDVESTERKDRPPELLCRGPESGPCAEFQEDWLACCFTWLGSSHLG